MKAYRYIELTESDLLAVESVYKTDKRHHVRKKCHTLMLSHQGRKVPELAIIFKVHCDTIRTWFDKWTSLGLSGFAIKAGRGVKAKLDTSDAAVVAYVKEKVRAQPLKLLSIIEDISKHLGKTISKGMLIKFLKSLRYSYRRIRKVLKKTPDVVEHDAKLKAILHLVSLEKQNFLKIYFADESGFNETPNVPYGWQSKDEPLSMPSSHGQRWNVFGIMSSDNELFHSKTKGSIDSQFVINNINVFAQSPNRAPRSVIIIDNAKIHHSAAFKAEIPTWQEQGVEIFYLPTYSPHLNRIETLWRKIKHEWLLPQDYVSWKTLTEKIEHILANFGTEFSIEFAPF
jgi:transposase